MAKKNRREIDRREFLKVLGVGTATTTAALYGCSLVLEILLPVR